MNKTALHADDRLRERTRLKPEVLKRLRQQVSRARLPRGTLHARLGGEGYAVLKDLGGRHVVATVLSRNMQPPGPDVTSHLERTPMKTRTLDDLRTKLAASRSRGMMRFESNPHFWGGGRDVMAYMQDLKRGVPERFVGKLTLNDQGKVDSVFMDPALKGMNLAPTLYGYGARTAKGGIVQSDISNSRGSWGVYEGFLQRNLDRMFAAQRAERDPASVVNIMPLHATYASAGGTFMRPHLNGPTGASSYGQGNFLIRMPSKSLLTKEPYTGHAPPGNFLDAWQGMADPRNILEGKVRQEGSPWTMPVLQEWRVRPAHVRVDRGQPHFPAPNRKGTFGQFVRETEEQFGPARPYQYGEPHPKVTPGPKLDPETAYKARMARQALMLQRGDLVPPRPSAFKEVRSPDPQSPTGDSVSGYITLSRKELEDHYKSYQEAVARAKKGAPVATPIPRPKPKLPEPVPSPPGPSTFGTATSSEVDPNLAAAFSSAVLDPARVERARGGSAASGRPLLALPAPERSAARNPEWLPPADSSGVMLDRWAAKGKAR